LANIDSRFDNVRLVCDCPVSELSRKVRLPDGTTVPLPQKFTPPKFFEALPESDLAHFARSRLCDEAGATSVLAQPIIVAAEQVDEVSRFSLKGREGVFR
jgi:hypothetical protein